MTVTDLITASIQRLTGDSQIPSPDDIATGLLRLNDLVDSLKIEGLLVNTFSRVLFTISGASTYAVGASAVVNIDRPSNASTLVFALLDSSVSPAVETPLDNYSEDDYRGITVKTLTATYPLGFYYNPTTPTGTLIPWPIANGSSLQGVVYAPNPTGEFALTDVLALPQGYRRFYRDELAVELGPDFGLTPHPRLVQSAIDAKASAKRSNVRIVEMESDAAGLTGAGGGGSVYDFYSGND